MVHVLLFRGVVPVFEQQFILLERVIAGAVALAVAYGVSVGAQWLLRCGLFRDAGWDPILQQWVSGDFGHFLMAVTVAFGGPSLLLAPSRIVQSTWRVSLGGGALVGVCMAGGVAVLFGVLLDGRGIGFFVGSLLLFGGVTGVVAVAVFRVLARRGRKVAPERRQEMATPKRVAIAAGALLTSGGLVCGLLFVVSALFDRQHSPAWWLPLYRFLLVFLLSGWLLFGLPILVLGPAREHFQRPRPSTLAGGAAGVIFVECYFQTMFVSGNSLSLATVGFHACFGALAFLLGALTSYLYVQWLGRCVKYSKAW